MELNSLKGPHRIVRFPRGNGQLSRTRYEPFADRHQFLTLY